MNEIIVVLGILTLIAVIIAIILVNKISPQDGGQELTKESGEAGKKIHEVQNRRERN